MNPHAWPPLRRLSFHSAGTVTYSPGATFGPRLLKDFELVWILSGNVVAWQDGRRIPAPAGTIILSHPGMVDAYDWSPTSETVHAFVHFGIGRLPREWPKPTRWPTTRSLAPNSALAALFRYILGLHAAAKTVKAAVLLPTLELLLRTFIVGSTDLPDQLHEDLPPLIERVFHLIRDRVHTDPSHPLRLDDLASTVHVSPQQVCRVFRQRLGIGPMECARLLRLEKAATWLERTDDPVGSVGEHAGFASPYHFSKAFKQVYGQSPRTYRQEFRAALRTGLPNPRKPALYGTRAMNWLAWGQGG